MRPSQFPFQSGGRYRELHIKGSKYFQFSKHKRPFVSGLVRITIGNLKMERSKYKGKERRMSILKPTKFSFFKKTYFNRFVQYEE